MPTTVLIVDDHPSCRLSARRTLEAAGGYSVVGEAVDGAGAIDAVREFAPDLVLLDIQLPDFDGFEVAARLGESDGCPTIVFMSTRDGSDFGDRIAASRARGFVAKDELSGEAIAALIG